MKIRIKLFFITGVVFLSVIIISSISVWTMNETTRLRNTIERGVELTAQARNLHSLMKDLMFDIFTPQTYRLLKDIIHTPRFNTTLREFNEAVVDFKDDYYVFMESPRVKNLLRDEELMDAYEVAKIMSVKAFQKIEAFQGSLDHLVESGVLGEETIYEQLQTDQDPSIPIFFDEVRVTSYYLTNSFESFLRHFIRSLQAESSIIRRQILALFWILTVIIGFLTVILSLLFSGKISKRIKIVESALRKISMGDFSAQLNIRTKDEFGLLSTNFNSFIKDLKWNVDSVLNLMRDVGNSITEQLNLYKIMELIVESAVMDTNADGAAILMADDRNKLKVHKTAGTFPYSEGLLIAERVEHTASEQVGAVYLLEKVLVEGKTLFIRNTEEHGQTPLLAPEDRQRFHSILGIPLLVSKQVLGALCIVTTEQNSFLTDLDYTNFNTFADYAALIIDNFFKYKELLEKREAEYQALQSQIHPHFLYNVLNGLVGLNRLGDKKSLENAIFALKGMLRYTLEQNGWTTIAEEFQFLTKYCDLQKIRFQERLAVGIHYDEDVANFKIPKLLLQPLVENAIIHGIEPLDRPGRLDVSARLIGNNNSSALGIYIVDNGTGFLQEAGENRKHIGLSNVQERLLIAFPKASLDIQSRIGLGTKVGIEIDREEVGP